MNIKLHGGAEWLTGIANKSLDWRIILILFIHAFLSYSLECSDYEADTWRPAVTRIWDIVTLCLRISLKYHQVKWLKNMQSHWANKTQSCRQQMLNAVWENFPTCQQHMYTIPPTKIQNWRRNNRATTIILTLWQKLGWILKQANVIHLFWCLDPAYMKKEKDCM